MLDECNRRGIPVLAVLSEESAQRAAVFHAGFSDYISYPFIAAEIAVRLDGIAAVRSASGVQLVSEIINRAVEHGFHHPIEPTAQEVALVEATCAFMQKDIAVHHELDDLARRMGSNRNSLARAFNHVLGKGAYAWLREKRMDAAASLLRTTALSIQEISFDVGYEDPGNFSTAFKHLYGIPPRSYRQIVRNSKK